MSVTVQIVHDRLDYDGATGVLRWKCRVARCVHPGDVAGNVHKRNGYVCIGLTVGGKTKSYFAHRLAWALAYGEWPLGVIDHIDGCRTNNRLANLRDTTKAVNAQNIRRAFTSNKSSGLLGAHYHAAKQAFAAEIHVEGRNRHLGYFGTAAEAHGAYLQAKRALHDGCEI